ncbi:MAG: hypothetical protein JWL98_845, partial [Xanthomonadaceae bacterium]|nr:hypothetical protein [Xanthomonadaceae bacterium]
MNEIDLGTGTSAQADGIRGKVAIVAGATAGLGRAVALKLAAQGAIVVATGRNSSAGDDAVRAIEAAGGRALFPPADMENAAVPRGLVAKAVALFGAGTSSSLVPVRRLQYKVPMNDRKRQQRCVVDVKIQAPSIRCWACRLKASHRLTGFLGFPSKSLR